MGCARHHIAYLLRLWRVQDEAGPEWRASLESADTEEQRGFGSLKELFAFLEKRTEMETNADDADEGDLRHPQQ
jgi:hypothetical protein